MKIGGAVLFTSQNSTKFRLLRLPEHPQNHPTRALTPSKRNSRKCKNFGDFPGNSRKIRVKIVGKSPYPAGVQGHCKPPAGFRGGAHGSKRFWALLVRFKRHSEHILCLKRVKTFKYYYRKSKNIYTLIIQIMLRIYPYPQPLQKKVHFWNNIERYPFGP